MSPTEARIAEVEQAIRDLGFRVTYRQFVEDHKTPGFPGQIAGRVDRDDAEVVISTAATPSPILRLRVLKHELHHLVDPGWDCGNRTIFDQRPAPADREWLTR